MVSVGRAVNRPPGLWGQREGRGLLALVLVQVAGVLDHLATRLGAVAARLGATRHVLVLGIDILTSLAAHVTDLGARFAGGDRRRPPAGDDLGGQRTEVATVGAGRQ